MPRKSDRERPAPEVTPADPSGLLPLVYDELRKLARRLFARERGEHTLQPTALVHEVFLRLVEQNRVDWQGRTHFYAIGARLMRHVLIDHARRRGRWKRGREQARVTFEEAFVPGMSAELSLAEVLSVHEALGELAELDARQALIVEQRYFGGLTADEIAGDLGVSKRTVEGELTHARAWLRRRLAGSGPA